MSRDSPPCRVIFDPTSEIFATDNSGAFTFPLLEDGRARFATSAYDEIRFVVSIWHPSGNRAIDLDRAYVEFQANLAANEDHWVKLAEVEPVVSPYNGSGRFDGWIILPIFSTDSAFAVVGSGFEPRARLQVRASAYLVS